MLATCDKEGVMGADKGVTACKAGAGGCALGCKAQPPCGVCTTFIHTVGAKLPNIRTGTLMMRPLRMSSGCPPDKRKLACTI
jgi:hypothetical protein